MTVADRKKFEKGETIYQLCPHLSQMRTTKYMPFTRKKRLFEKIWANRGAAAPIALPLWIRHSCTIGVVRGSIFADPIQSNP